MIDRAFARRLFHTVPFSIGLVGVIAASAPLAIGSILDALGLIRIGNGLGVGMWFFFVFWPSALLTVWGVARAARQH